jgi:hypothetical protein
VYREHWIRLGFVVQPNVSVGETFFYEEVLTNIQRTWIQLAQQVGYAPKNISLAVFYYEFISIS